MVTNSEGRHAISRNLNPVGHPVPLPDVHGETVDLDTISGAMAGQIQYDGLHCLGHRYFQMLSLAVPAIGQHTRATRNREPI